MLSLEAAVCRCSSKQVFLKIFAIFVAKHLQSLFNKVAGLTACNFIKKRLKHRYFPVNIAKLSITAFLQDTSFGCLCLLKALTESKNKHMGGCFMDAQSTIRYKNRIIIHNSKTLAHSNKQPNFCNDTITSIPNKYLANVIVSILNYIWQKVKQIRQI